MRTENSLASRKGMNRSVACSGWCPSQPPRTIRAFLRVGPPIRCVHFTAGPRSSVPVSPGPIRLATPVYARGRFAERAEIGRATGLRRAVIDGGPPGDLESLRPGLALFRLLGSIGLRPL